MGSRFSYLAATLLLAACAGPGDGEVEQSFRAQFASWYAANPPDETERSALEIALLKRYKPIYFLAAAAPDPVDFYADYMAHGTLYAGAGKVIAHNPDRTTLNTWRDDPSTEFIHEGPGVDGKPTVYGRVARDTVPFESGPRDLTFLTYTLVFATSGLPMGLSWWEEAAVWLVGDATDWHQLDHYINVTLALDTAFEPPEPVAAIFQQHNYLRTYRLGGAAGRGRLDWPEDDRLRVDIALRSNELYPHLTGRGEHRAASYMDLVQARWLVLGEDPPLRASYDVTDPKRRLDDLPLIALPHADAFYTFQGSLGEARTLPGRSGPPGADFNTLVGLKRPAAQLLSAYWHEGLAEYPELIAAAVKAAWAGQAVDLTSFATLFTRDWHAE